MYYFSYGSNMSTKRLIARAPGAVKVGSGRLAMHQLRFHKISHRDGSAKCDAEETGNSEHVVYGVLFQITELEKTRLDRYEGLGQGYTQKTVEVELLGGNVIHAYLYSATLIDPGLKPYSWYKEHVLRGAREHALPESYIRMIEKITSIPDTDRTRHISELSIYR